MVPEARVARMNHPSDPSHLILSYMPRVRSNPGGPSLIAEWSKALSMIASWLSALPGLESWPGHVRKSPVT